MNWLTDNRLALLLLAAIAGALIVHAVPGPNDNLVSAIVGGLIGFLTGAMRRPSDPPIDPQEPSP